MSNMSPYEIRLHLLKMAQAMIEQDYYGKRESISNDWQVKVENARHAGQIPPYIVTGKQIGRAHV